MRERFQVSKIEGWTTYTGGLYSLSYCVHDLDYAGALVAEYGRTFKRPISLKRLEVIRQEAGPSLRREALLHARALNVNERRLLEA